MPANSFDDLLDTAQAPKVNPFDDLLAAQVTAQPSEKFINDMKPKSTLGEVAGGLKNAAVGGAKFLTNTAGGAAGLLAKLLDKTGVTRHYEDQVHDNRESLNGLIDQTMGTENPGTGDQIMQSIGEMGSALAMPVGRLAGGASKLMEMIGAGPRVAQMAGSAATNVGLGAIEGEGNSHADAGAALGLGGSALGELMKAGGGRVIKSYLKGGHTGRSEGLDKDWVVNNELGGSPAQMTQKAEGILSNLRDAQNQIVAQKGAAPIDALGIFHDIEQQINSSHGIAKNMGSLPDAQAQLKKYFNDYVKIADPSTGEVPLNMAWEMKKKAANDAVDLYKAARVGGDVKSKVAQGVSALVASKMSDALERTAPELTALNPEFTKVIPFAKTLARRNVIAGQHNPIGLDELAALEAGANFMVHGHWEGGLLPILQRLSKSPYAGQKMRQLGQGVGSARGALAGSDAGTALMGFIQGQQEQESQ